MKLREYLSKVKSAYVGRPCAHCGVTLTIYDVVKFIERNGENIPVHQKCLKYIEKIKNNEVKNEQT